MTGAGESRDTPPPLVPPTLRDLSVEAERKIIQSNCLYNWHFRSGILLYGHLQPQSTLSLNIKTRPMVKVTQHDAIQEELDLLFCVYSCFTFFVQCLLSYQKASYLNKQVRCEGGVREIHSLYPQPRPTQESKAMLIITNQAQERESYVWRHLWPVTRSSGATSSAYGKTPRYPLPSHITAFHTKQELGFLSSQLLLAFPISMFKGSAICTIQLLYLCFFQKIGSFTS